nr:type II toxin-antitoxin system RelE/ParE family toxin [Rhizobium sp. RU36D]
MQRAEVRFRPESLRDLQDIFYFILTVSQSPAVARGYVGRIRRRCESIAHAPNAGRPRYDLLPGLRIVPFERSAVIAYKVENGIVLVTNVFFGRRDYEALYRDEQ